MIQEVDNTMRRKCSILSFDVGIRHLAYAILADANNAVEKGSIDNVGTVETLDMIDLGTVHSVEQCASRLADELVRRFAGQSFDYVLIERQPRARSIMMVAIQMFLCMHFSQCDRARQVLFSSASRKLSMNMHAYQRTAVENAVGGVGSSQSSANKTHAKTKYADNKSYAIAAAKKYLAVLPAKVSLDAFKKKDDVADALLQAIAFVENDGACGRPRRPLSSTAGAEERGDGGGRTQRRTRRKKNETKVALVERLMASGLTDLKKSALMKMKKNALVDMCAPSASVQRVSKRRVQNHSE